MNGKSGARSTVVALCLHLLHQPEVPESFSKRSEKLFFIIIFFFPNHIQQKAGSCISHINGSSGTHPTTIYL